MKLYLAGALFNEAEIAQRLKEGKLLKIVNQYMKHYKDLKKI